MTDADLRAELATERTARQLAETRLADAQRQITAARALNTYECEWTGTECPRCELQGQPQADCRHLWPPLPPRTRVTWHTLVGDPRWGEIVRPDWQRDLHNQWQPCYRVIGPAGVEHLVGADEITVL